MIKKLRKIHVIGFNSFNFADLTIESQDLFIKKKNIAVPYTFIKNIQPWCDNNPNKDRNIFESKSNYELISWIKQCQEDIVLLSRGDPLWFGIGRILIENFSKEELKFYPSNTCLQMAFSKLKIPWHDVNCISIHGRDTPKLIKALKSRNSNLAVIPDPKGNNLEIIRKNILELKLENIYNFWVLEELGLINEKIRQIDINQELPRGISNLNIAILTLKNDFNTENNQYPLFGLSDNLFKTFEDRPNLLTKREIRIQILADLELSNNVILWDIGAGSGSIGLEALKLCSQIKLISIDKRIGTKELIKENANRLGVFPTEIIEADIVNLLSSNFDKSYLIPNRVIIGGCNKVSKIFAIKTLASILSKNAIIVLPIITYEVLREIKKVLEDLDFITDLNLIQTYKGISIADGTRFDPNNPIFIIKGKKNF